MRYLKRTTAIISLVASLFAIGSVSTQAQVRTTRVIVIQRPFFHTGFWRPYGFYDPFYDPYFYDPYLRAQREKYYLRQDVKNKREHLAKVQRKYRKDGYLSPKEQEKLMKDRLKYEKAVAKLNNFNRNY